MFMRVAAQATTDCTVDCTAPNSVTTGMPTPPEVLFDRYFRSDACHRDNRRHYKGKQNLSNLSPQLASFLTAIQAALNESLNNEKQNVHGHVEHPPFHFDYVISAVPNAIAFTFADVSFIGITMPLINTLWDACVELSKSVGVGALLDMPETPEREEAILTVMFQTQLIFVVLHEWTHHVHGHCSRYAGSEFFNEVVSSDTAGNLEEQALEMDADSYAVYYVLAHLITGPRREQATSLLNCKHVPASVQDEILFFSFLMAIGAFLYALSPTPVDLSKVYTRTHPLPATRMAWIVGHAKSWCGQNNRSELAANMMRERYQALMVLVARAIAGMTVEPDWSEQTAFLKSEAGSKYFKQLEALFRTNVQALYS
jgi:hypothetical protein